VELKAKQGAGTCEGPGASAGAPQIRNRNPVPLPVAVKIGSTVLVRLDHRSTHTHHLGAAGARGGSVPGIPANSQQEVAARPPRPSAGLGGGRRWAASIAGWLGWGSLARAPPLRWCDGFRAQLGCVWKRKVGLRVEGGLAWLGIARS